MNPQYQDHWEVLLRFLPAGWEEKALELGALSRRRKIDSARTLLRVLLIHLANGMSLRTTAAYAHEAKLCSINDAALLHRLKVSEDWLHWMCAQMFGAMNGGASAGAVSSRLQLRAVEGALISEPGATGSDWRLHYCLRLRGLRCDAFRITGPKTAESFQHFEISPDDLLLGDRRFCGGGGIAHVLRGGGHVVAELSDSRLPLFSRDGKPFRTLAELRGLKALGCGDWDVYFQPPGGKEFQKGRLCAIRKTEQAAELSRKRLRAGAAGHRHPILPEALERADFVCVYTTASRRLLRTREVLELYCERWRAERSLKRLGRTIAVGHLPKQNEESFVAWLYGKMLVAMLMERMRREAEAFSPWGCPIRGPCGPAGDFETLRKVELL